MDVELYVYDLSGGMARQYSVALTGVHIDAIYHTAVVVGGVEYFFGQGIHRKIPGSTHHGRPMEVMRMGRTDLPLEVIDEYIQSLETIYTPESYDLFVHNCNNFSQDLCMFLVGKSIPEKISSLPETFLRTPIGQMMRGQIDQSMRRMTQAPDAVSGRNARSMAHPQTQINGAARTQTNGVHSSRPTLINSAPQAKGPQTRSKHPHTAFKVPLLSKRVAEPILAATCPPLEKLLTRITSAHGEDVQPLKDLAEHVKRREAKGSADAPLPDMHAICSWITHNFSPSGAAAFAIVDLLRISAIDPRVTAYLTTDTALLKTIYSPFAASSSGEIPYNLHFTSLQLCMNLFSSAVAQEAMMHDNGGNDLRSLLGDVIVASLLRDNSKIRLQAALLVTNLAAIDHNARLDGRDDVVCINMMVDGAVESALVQAVIDEAEQAALEKLLLALGLMLYLAPEDAGIRELCEAMDVSEALRRKAISSQPLTREVMTLLKLS